MYEVHYAGPEGVYGSRQFGTEEEARQAYVTPEYYFRTSPLIILEGPNGLYEERTNHVRTDTRDWQREFAHQAGMMGGCFAYNDAMGW